MSSIMVVADFVSNNAILDFFYILFNGISEVPLFSSPITGILILAGVFLASRSAGVMMVISGLIGAGVAILLGAPYGLVAFGLFGYNSILTGMAFWSGPFAKSNKATFFISIFGAAVTAVVWMAMAHLMGDMFILNGLQESWAIPGFTSSFIFTTWTLMYATKRFGHDIWPEPIPAETEELIKGSGNPSQITESTFKWTPGEFMKATLKGVSQVTFVENWKTGVFWVVGLTLAFELAPILTGQDRPWWTNAFTAQWNEFSPLYLGGAMALIGSAIGVAMAILTKLPTAETRAGLHGFNQVLVMIALTSFVPLTPQAFMMAVFATVSCCFVMPALQRIFGTWGLPALTGPFVFTAWIFLLGISGFTNIPAGIGWARP
ncbi:MAG TPA: urea transporter [Nitrososphaeraceae archaeon]|nr:urea transporter [Nitrososphaeraceae archaeon]